jgi:hypothetical protein
MAWEDRGGKLYYYRKIRRGPMVISEYIGSSEFAELLFEMDEIDREERRAYLRKWKEDQGEMRCIDLGIAQLNETLMNLVTATMLVSGYHPHKGQWRRLRYAE